jgi:DNA-binding NarL/FixJ family response regulator
VIRVVLVDDQDLIRAGFRMILSTDTDIEVVGEGRDGAEAIALVRDLTPDVVLMDIRMPGMDGIEATRRICADYGDTKVLVLTTFDLDEYVYEALRAGAAGFLLKDAKEQQLLAAIRVVADGGSLFAPTVTRRLVERFVSEPADEGQQPPVESVDASTLSPREIEVMVLVARGLPNLEIAQALFISEHTTKTHVANILAKLGLRNRVEMVVRAYETGLVRPS